MSQPRYVVKVDEKYLCEVDDNEMYMLLDDRKWAVRFQDRALAKDAARGVTAFMNIWEDARVVRARWAE